MKKAHEPSPDVQAAQEEFAAQVDQYRTMARSYYRPRAVASPPAEGNSPVTPTRTRAHARAPEMGWMGAVVVLFAIIGVLTVLSWIAQIL